jgi:hypothetical protein
MISNSLFRRLSGFLLLVLLLFGATQAHAQWLEPIEVIRGQDTADIVIHFAEKILYQSHAPLNEGKLLRIAFRPMDGQAGAREFIEETIRAPKVDRVPRVTVVYAHLEDAIVVTFPETTRYSVRPGADGRSLVITVPLLPGPPLPPAPPPAAVAPPPAVPGPQAPPSAAEAVPAPPSGVPPAAEIPPAAEPVPAAPTQTPAEVEALAKGFMEEARRAIAANDGPTAVNRLNRVLGLPSNSQTESAQALIGEARELNGEIAKARAEYTLYLRLFPNGAAAARVRDRLAVLPRESAVPASRALPKEPGPAEWNVFGSVSAYYYTGKSQIDTLNPPPPGQLTFSQSTLSLVDQNSLITSINLNARRRDAFTDTRIVVRDTDNKNYLSPSRSYNRLYSAYVEHNDRRLGYYARAGRQNPNGMGVLDRFDGVQAGYTLGAQWRVNGVYGDAVEFLSPFKKNFYGLSVDYLPQAGRPGASLYAINQTLDGYANRRAVGSELRYFDGHLSGYGMLDYDLLYHGVNIAMLQGNYVSDAGTNYFLVLDHRRAPSFGLTNALLAAPGFNLRDLIAVEGLETVRAQARALAAVSDMFGVGFTHPWTERWQLGADYRLSQISATEPVVVIIPLGVIGTCLGTIDPADPDNCRFDTASQQGTGKNHVLTLQAIGTNLFATNAVGVASVSFILAPTYSGQSVSLSYVLPFRERWRFDTNLRYYTQRDDFGGHQDRISPSFKLSYQWRTSLYFEGEVGEEISNSSSVGFSDHIKRDYFYLGLRWDFR